MGHFDHVCLHEHSNKPHNHCNSVLIRMHVGLILAEDHRFIPFTCWDKSQFYTGIYRFE